MAAGGGYEPKPAVVLLGGEKGGLPGGGLTPKGGATGFVTGAGAVVTGGGSTANGTGGADFAWKALTGGGAGGLDGEGIEGDDIGGGAIPGALVDAPGGSSSSSSPSAGGGVAPTVSPVALPRPEKKPPMFCTMDFGASDDVVAGIEE